MREAASHRLRLDSLRNALNTQSALILENMLRLQKYVAGPVDAPAPQLESIEQASSDVRQQCLLMMCRQAPMASDLKYTLAALRIGQDYERLHELTASLGERFQQLRACDSKLIVEIGIILSHITSIHASMRSTWTRDVYETEQIAADPAASALIGVINQELEHLRQHYVDFIRQGKYGIELCADLILTCRHLARMTQLLEALPREMHSFEQSVDELLPLLR